MEITIKNTDRPLAQEDADAEVALHPGYRLVKVYKHDPNEWLLVLEAVKG